MNQEHDYTINFKATDLDIVLKSLQEQKMSLVRNTVFDIEQQVIAQNEAKINKKDGNPN
jgi:hypothetical protein